MIRIILIRHGRTAWNTGEGQGKRFRGMVDLPLADEGVAQAMATAQRLADVPLAAVYSSPLRRALRTAQFIAEPHALQVAALPGLRSMDYGAWAGLFDTEVARRWPEVFRQWRRDPFTVQIPGGEGAADLRERVTDALHEVLGRHTDGDHIVVVSHQVVTKTLVCVLAGLPSPAYWRIRQDLANLSTFDYDPGTDRFTVVGLNDICHWNTALPRRAAGGTCILLIRHGQTAWNAGAGEERFRGHTDLPLDETGRAQAQALAHRLQDVSIAALYASPLQRARETLMPVAAQSGLVVQPEDGLMDIHYGLFQGMTHRDASAAYPDPYRLWHTSPSQVRFPAGEGLSDVQARLLALLDNLAARHPRQTIALAGHQIVNKVLTCTLLGLDLDQIWRIQQDTGGFDIFQQIDGVWHTLCANDTCHLR